MTIKGAALFLTAGFVCALVSGWYSSPFCSGGEGYGWPLAWLHPTHYERGVITLSRDGYAFDPMRFAGVILVWGTAWTLLWAAGRWTWCKTRIPPGETERQGE